MHTHSLSIHPDSGRALRPWELALLLAVCVTLLTGTWAQRAAGIGMNGERMGMHRMSAFLR